MHVCLHTFKIYKYAYGYTETQHHTLYAHKFTRNHGHTDSRTQVLAAERVVYIQKPNIYCEFNIESSLYIL